MNKYNVVVTKIGFKQDTLYIEATVNGKPFNGYLGVVVDLSDQLSADGEPDIRFIDSRVEQVYFNHRNSQTEKLFDFIPKTKDEVKKTIENNLKDFLVTFFENYHRNRHYYAMTVKNFDSPLGSWYIRYNQITPGSTLTPFMGSLDKVFSSDYEVNELLFQRFPEGIYLHQVGNLEEVKLLKTPEDVIQMFKGVEVNITLPVKEG